MLTFIKFVVGVPFVAICLLLIIGVALSVYAVKSRTAANKEYAEFIENLGKKKKQYSKSKKTLRITDSNVSSFVDGALSKAEQQYKSSVNKQKERYKLNKLKRNRKRNKIAKASRKLNR